MIHLKEHPVTNDNADNMMNTTELFILLNAVKTAKSIIPIATIKKNLKIIFAIFLSMGAFYANINRKVKV